VPLLRGHGRRRLGGGVLGGGRGRLRGVRPPGQQVGRRVGLVAERGGGVVVGDRLLRDRPRLRGQLRHGREPVQEVVGARSVEEERQVPAALPGDGRREQPSPHPGRARGRRGEVGLSGERAVAVAGGVLREPRAVVPLGRDGGRPARGVRPVLQVREQERDPGSLRLGGGAVGLRALHLVPRRVLGVVRDRGRRDERRRDRPDRDGADDAERPLPTAARRVTSQG